MKPSVQLLDLGTIDYKECWSRQQELFQRLIDDKTEEKVDPGRGGYLILCEHPHVYTLGKSGHEENLLVNGDFLRSVGASFYRTDRGGDITYHGPGQIVGYPILDLENLGMGLRDYIAAMEQSVVETVAELGIAARRSEGRTGVWIKDARGERKICAIGVRNSRFITMHGMALNVATDLKYFDYINPCGFTDAGVTSVDAETGRKTDIDLVKRILRDRMEKNMRINI